MSPSSSLLVVLTILISESLSISLPTVTPKPVLYESLEEYGELRKRDSITTEMSTCGYLDGAPSGIRTANSGYDCRVDTAHGIWGFCPTTVLAATDCGLAGYCVDTGGCSKGCGTLYDESTITTFTW